MWFDEKKTRKVELQCGHGLMTVETHFTFLVRSGRTGLQCGHGLMTVETPLRAVHGGRQPAASMRPRPDDRGDLGWMICHAPDTMLQCGHGLMTVETTSPSAIRAVWRRSFNAATA